MADLAETMPPGGAGSRQILERGLVWSIILAFLARISMLFGVGGFLERFGDGDTILDVVSWIFVALAVTCAGAIVAMSERAGQLGAHRVKRHVIAWAIVTVLVLAIWAFGEYIWFGIGWVYTALSDAVVAVINWVFGLFGSSYEGSSGSPAKLWSKLLGFFEDNGLFVAALAATVGLGLAAVGLVDDVAARPGRMERVFVANIVAKIAAVPMAVTALGVFVGATLWTVYHSFTNSKMLPNSKLIGFDQYERLWADNNNRWWQSIENLGIYAVIIMVFVLITGFLLAVLLDQKIRFENTFRTILLYPFALSFIVVGLVWQWLLTPQYGVQAIVRGLGWESFTFDPLFNQQIVMFGVCIAALWHGTGLVMCLMLAGLRGIDEEIWKASRVDGIPAWKTYLRIVIPMMRPVFVTTIVLIASGILRVYDLIVAQTSGGPGIASEVPAKYVYDYMFLAQNLGQGFAASTMMLLAVIVIVIPWAILEFGSRKQNG